MPTVRDNGSRVKRFRELKATLRTNRERLLVGIDIAQAEHVVHLRHAHTRVVTPKLVIPNTAAGFARLWGPSAPPAAGRWSAGSSRRGRTTRPWPSSWSGRAPTSS